MSDYSQILDTKDYFEFIPSSIFIKYKYITVDPAIQSGRPHIRGTRVIASDVFVAQMEKITLDQLIIDYKRLGINVTKEQLREAFEFTLESITRYIHGKKAKKTSK